VRHPEKRGGSGKSIQVDNLPKDPAHRPTGTGGGAIAKQEGIVPRDLGGNRTRGKLKGPNWGVVVHDTRKSGEETLTMRAQVIKGELFHKTKKRTFSYISHEKKAGGRSGLGPNPYPPIKKLQKTLLQKASAGERRRDRGGCLPRKEGRETRGLAGKSQKEGWHRPHGPEKRVSILKGNQRGQEKWKQKANGTGRRRTEGGQGRPRERLQDASLVKQEGGRIRGDTQT